MNIPILLPQPRQLETLGGEFTLPDSGIILVTASDPQVVRFTAVSLKEQLGEGWQINVGSVRVAGETAVSLNLILNSQKHAQGYELTVTTNGISIVAETAAGLFYGVQTLKQLFKNSRLLPTLRIQDWPDFPNRGVMLDISRDKVPTMETLFTLIDQLASWKVNQFQLYTEHTFAFRQHPVVWADASPITGEEILAIDAYCRERFIELVPNQNTFGHMRRWLVHDEYNHLSECPDGCDTIWGYFDEPFTLDPSEPGSIELVRSMLDELVPHFTSLQFNVGCDETIDLGQGRSAEIVKERGAGRVYLDFLMRIYREVKRHGRTMQFWGDILVNHPELVSELPRDVVALEWGYEAGHDFDKRSAIFAKAGIPFYVCPGTSSWNTIAGRTDNSLGNLKNAAENGLKHGAVGYLITDWGDNGHWQPAPVSSVGFAYGAAVSWGYDANVELDIKTAVSEHAFCNNDHVLGELAYELGNAFKNVGIQSFNGTILFYTMQATEEVIRNHLKHEDESIADRLDETKAAIDQIMDPLKTAYIHREDADLVKREFQWAANMLKHACDRILWVFNGNPPDEKASLVTAVDALIAEHQLIWHTRNRPGGFRESVARMEKMKEIYD
ncbi:MAG: glycoside hydrolase family 20 zincin-like fold domain-containing protein [Chloroflexota bacterium]